MSEKGTFHQEMHLCHCSDTFTIPDTGKCVFKENKTNQGDKCKTCSPLNYNIFKPLVGNINHLLEAIINCINVYISKFCLPHVFKLHIRHWLQLQIQSKDNCQLVCNYFLIYVQQDNLNSGTKMTNVILYTEYHYSYVYRLVLWQKNNCTKQQYRI